MSDEYMLRVESRFRVDSSWKEVVSPKSVICRYYGLPGGCVRGDKCFYAHGQEDLQKRTRETSPGLVQNTASSRLQLGKINHSQEDLARKIFVGGLSSSVESDDLREFFEETFGPVLDAVVIETHLGDQVHSRGFGFVTFENEKSVVSAVQAHYVNIFGKKVEIKGAVPRLGSSHLVIGKGSSGIPTPIHEISRDTRKYDEIRQRLLDINNLPSVITNAQVQHDTQWCDIGLSLNIDAACVNSTPFTSPGCSPERGEERRTWLPIFEQWLPKFLMEVCNRLKEGEWYPLSSLKGDFRATCGLELDHEAIGFHKLNDFIRSLPHLCRIKIVPVGLGPATHMVLLPVGSRMTIPTSHPIQELHPNSHSAGTSLIETGRSYAAAICHGTATGGTGGTGWGSTALVENNVNNLPREHAVQAAFPTEGSNAQDVVNLNFLRQASILVEKSTGKENWDKERGFVLNGKSDGANFIHQNCLHCMDTPVSCPRPFESYYPSGVQDSSDFFIQCDEVPDFNPQTKYMEIGIHDQEGLKFPFEQLTLDPFSNFNPDHTVPPIYSSTWDLYVPSSSDTSPEHSSPGSNLSEESPHINVLPRPGGQARWPLENLFLLQPHERDQDKVSAACSHCKRKAIWVAFPCKHLALCSACKDSSYMHWGEANHSSCPVCCGAVEKWYALYH